MSVRLEQVLRGIVIAILGVMLWQSLRGQSDIGGHSGLATVLQLVARSELPVPVIEFGHRDIVRSEICAMWARAFHEAGI